MRKQCCQWEFSAYQCNGFNVYLSSNPMYNFCALLVNVYRLYNMHGRIHMSVHFLISVHLCECTLCVRMLCLVSGVGLQTESIHIMRKSSLLLVNQLPVYLSCVQTSYDFWILLYMCITIDNTGLLEEGVWNWKLECLWYSFNPWRNYHGYGVSTFYFLTKKWIIMMYTVVQ